MPQKKNLKLTTMTEIASLYGEKLDLNRALKTLLKNNVDEIFLVHCISYFMDHFLVIFKLCVSMHMCMSLPWCKGAKRTNCENRFCNFQVSSSGDEAWSHFCHLSHLDGPIRELLIFWLTWSKDVQKHTY